MQVDHPCSEFSILGRRRWAILIFRFASGRIIKSPMLHVPLTALHHGATDSGLPAFPIGVCVTFGKMQVGVRHDEIFANSAETQITVRFFERQRMGRWSFLAV